MQKLAWNCIYLCNFVDFLAQIRLGQTRRAFECRVLETEIWKSELHKCDSGGSGHSLSSKYIEFLGFGKLFHGNVPICTNFVPFLFHDESNTCSKLKVAIKKHQRALRFCSNNLGNWANWVIIYVLLGWVGGLNVPQGYNFFVDF